MSNDISTGCGVALHQVLPLQEREEYDVIQHPTLETGGSQGEGEMGRRERERWESVRGTGGEEGEGEVGVREREEGERGGEEGEGEVGVRERERWGGGRGGKEGEG